MGNMWACKACLSVLLAGVLSMPMPASAFWAGPGCFFGNMLGGGGFSGGFGFSTGARGMGYAHPYGVLPLYGAPYPVEPGTLWISPAPPPGADESVPRRAAEVLHTNIWRSEILQQPEARGAGAYPIPRNRWQP